MNDSTSIPAGNKDVLTNINQQPKTMPVGYEKWISTAREMLITEGIQGLGLRRLAARMNVTTGAFYHLFDNFDDFLDLLLNHWDTENCKSFDLIFKNSDLTPKDKYLHYIQLLFDRSRYDPKFDSAVREWARSSKLVSVKVEALDKKRIKAFTSLFTELGYCSSAAEVRAHLIYFHQIGYHFIEYSETQAERLKRLPFYAEIFCADAIDATSGLSDIDDLKI